MHLTLLLCGTHKNSLLNSKNAWRILGQESYAFEVVQHYGWDVAGKAMFVPIIGNAATSLQEFEQLFAVDESVPLRWRSDFVISGEWPLPGMLHNPGPDHVQIDVQHAFQQMLVRIHGCGMVTVFPKHPLAYFALVVILGGSVGNQLD